MSPSDRRDDPPALSPREAWRRFLNHKQREVRESSMKSYRYRLKLFVEWCEVQGFERIDELTGWDLDEFENYRGAITAPITLEKEMITVKNFLEYLDRLGVTDGIAEAVHVPVASDEDRTDTTRLAEPDAVALIEYYRSTPVARGTRRHVCLELEWFIGARQGGIRALDVRDVDLDDCFVEFHHREGTTLKNGPGHHPVGGERFVGIPPSVASVLERWLDQHRDDVHDEHGRQPFVTTPQGRPHLSTLRNTAYVGTIPCLHGPCPHGRDPEDCEWTRQATASQCPSSRSPHQIRTGSIIWQRDLGLPAPVVAERVNASIDTISRYYDHQTARDRLERRRRGYVDQLEIEDT